MSQIIIYTICAEILVMAVYEIRRRLRKRCLAVMEAYRKSIPPVIEGVEDFDANSFCSFHTTDGSAVFGFIKRDARCLAEDIKTVRNRGTCSFMKGIGAIYDEQIKSASHQ